MRKEKQLRNSGILLFWILISVAAGCAQSSDTRGARARRQPNESTAKIADPDAKPASNDIALDTQLDETVPGTTIPDEQPQDAAPPDERGAESFGPELAPPAVKMRANRRDEAMPRMSRSMVQPRSHDLAPPPDRHGFAPARGDDTARADLKTAVPRPSEKQPDAANAGAKTGASFTLVKVFYATDRAMAEPASTGVADRTDLLPPAAGIAVTMLLLALGVFRRGRRLFWSLAVLTSFVTVAWAGVWLYGEWTRGDTTIQKGTQYGNERGPMQMGSCLVSIPKSHQIGKVESPSILRLEVREDVRKHIVLQRTEPQSKPDFYQTLRQRIARSAEGEVFIFVHGYNVTFEAAARRTAQIAYDVQFSGAPIFFSWPSQGGLLKYTVDETNVDWAVPDLKQFLLDVVHNSGAKSVNLIAHSMGSRALTQALRELELELKENSALFSQVILAAPDIDAEIFRRDLAPALVKASQRVTLYASSNDQALAASKQVHGYARAGESGNGLVVMPGVDTIDVSAIDTSILGHSYYGSSNPILRDIYFLIHDALPAARRRWLRPASYDGLTYWVFQQVQKTAARPIN